MYRIRKQLQSIANHFPFANAGHTQTNQKRNVLIKLVVFQCERWACEFCKTQIHSLSNKCFPFCWWQNKNYISNNESEKEALVYNHELGIVHCSVKVECRISIEYMYYKVIRLQADVWWLITSDKKSAQMRSTNILCTICDVWTPMHRVTGFYSGIDIFLR